MESDEKFAETTLGEKLSLGAFIGASGLAMGDYIFGSEIHESTNHLIGYIADIMPNVAMFSLAYWLGSRHGRGYELNRQGINNNL